MPRGKNPEPEITVSQVEFVDPPPVPQRYDWEAIAEQLKANPGKWALIFERDRTSVVNALRMGTIAPVHPDLGFVLRTTNNVRHPHRTCSLFMRYLPENVKPLRDTITEARKDT